MSDLISRQAAIDEIVAWTVEDRPDIEMPTDLVGRINALPSAQPEPIRLHVDHAFTEEEIKNLKQKISDSPIVFIPSAEKPFKELWHWDTVDGINATTVLKQTISDINNMPTIPQPEIIRCRECRYKYGSACDNFAGVWVKDDDFCSRAERREVSE